ncbi:hypothetical protein GCM10022215_25030 [Nocardioides fonticola]|uniref:Uncharacterized protein n=1 Tax=Nocardioides fonticola TaxID=450363 RepID=A0ABP7XKE1_9ACTN
MLGVVRVRGFRGSLRSHLNRRVRSHLNRRVRSHLNRRVASVVEVRGALATSRETR